MVQIWRRALAKLGLHGNLRFRVRGVVLTPGRTNLGFALWLDPRSRDRDFDIIERFVAPGSTVVDVGANIGFTAIRAAQLAGPSGEVHAFEPHPKVFRQLEKHCRMNGCLNVRLYNCALGAQEGEAWITDHKYDDTNFLTPSGEGIKTRVRTLDTVLGGVGRVRLLKVDVEGAEYDVIRGGTGLLSRTDIIAFEMCDAFARRFVWKSEELLSLFMAAGFLLFQIGAGCELKPIGEDFRAGDTVVDLAAIRPNAL